MISQLIELGKSLEADWHRESFPDVALNALNNIESTCSLQEFEAQATKWMLEIDELPNQLNLYNSFGEPPITLFNNGKFAVDVYFWRKNDTLIHSHAFRGAFKVLYGKSLHEEFNVEVIKEFAKDMINSKITNSETKIMNTGDTQIIKPGMELVHRVLHLDNPTVTLCLRTVEDTELDQWHHLSTGLSYTKHNLDQLTIKRILYFQYLYNTNPETAESFLHTVLDQMNISAQLSLLESLYLNEFGLDYETSNIVVELIRHRCEEQTWFQMYEEHYNEFDSHLSEHQASRGDIKLLAHSINCNYGIEEIKRLLSLTLDKELKELSQNLLLDEALFDEDFIDKQTYKVQNFIESLKS